jgi:virginiamycin B lyase
MACLPSPRKLQNRFYTPGRMTTDGEVTRVLDRAAGQIIRGPDDNLWFIAGESIGRLTTQGEVTYFANGTGAVDLTVGPDDNIWFVMEHRVGRVTMDGAFTFFDLPPRGGYRGITTGPDGNLWITASWTAQVWRLTPTGVLSSFPLPPDIVGPYDITAGPDGNLWFTATKLGRITPEGVVTGFINPPREQSIPYNITVGPDGNIWFTEMVASQLGRVIFDPEVVHLPLIHRSTSLEDQSDDS